MAGYALTRPVLVDLTADDTSAALELALTHGMDLVLANKRPLAGRRSVSESLLADRPRARPPHSPRGHRRRGAADHRHLPQAHRVGRPGRPHRGSALRHAGYVLSEVGAGAPFSRAVRAAMSRGYTEPDPREDLSGMDVGRKALILARLLGYTGELSRASVESLVPKWARALPLEEFLRRLPELDDGMGAPGASRRRRKGTVLRYVATVTPAKIAVGLRAVPAVEPARRASRDRPISSSSPPRAIKTNPLVITGPGAGAEVTAAGVLNDILRLAGA